MRMQLVEGGVFTPILAFPHQGGRDFLESEGANERN